MMNFKQQAALMSMLQENGYSGLRLVGDKICGLHQFVFTMGLMVGLDDVGYERRYCYETEADALKALNEWDGIGHPSGPWIKLKGKYEGQGVDMLNPQLETL